MNQPLLLRRKRGAEKKKIEDNFLHRIKFANSKIYHRLFMFTTHSDITSYKLHEYVYISSI